MSCSYVSNTFHLYPHLSPILYWFMCCIGELSGQCSHTIHTGQTLFTLLTINYNAAHCFTCATRVNKAMF